MGVDTIYSSITNALDATLYQLDRAPAGQSLFGAVSIGINSNVGDATANAIANSANSILDQVANSFDVLYTDMDLRFRSLADTYLNGVSVLRDDFYRQLALVQASLKKQQAIDRVNIANNISNIKALFDLELLTIELALGNTNSVVLNLSNTTSTRFESTAQTISIIASTIDNNYAFFIDEVKTRTTSDLALANTITSLGATVGDAIGMITLEKDLRIANNLSIVNYVDTVSATVGNNYAFTVTEHNLRVANNLSIANTINTVAATVGNNYALLLSEQSARVTAIDGVANNYSSLSLAVGNNYSYLLTEIGARIANNVSTMNRIVDLETISGNSYAFIIDEATARVNGDAGVANSVSSLGITVSNNYSYFTNKIDLLVANNSASANTLYGLQIGVANLNSTLSTEVSLRIANNASTANSISSLGVTVGNNYAFLLNEASARVNGDAGVANSVSSLGITVSNNYAFLLNEATARVNGDAGVANSVSSLGIKVANNYGYLNTLNGIVVSPSGVYGKHSVTIDTNGYITGYELIGGGGSSAFTVNAAYFTVTQPGANNFTFQVESGIVKINGSLVVNGSINTAQVTSGAITNSVGAYTEGQLDDHYSTVVLAQEIIVNCSGGKNLIIGATHAYSTQHEGLYVQLNRTTNTIFQVTGNTYFQNVSHISFPVPEDTIFQCGPGGSNYSKILSGENMQALTVVDDPGAGWIKYSLYVGCGAGQYVSCQSRGLSCLELKR